MLSDPKVQIIIFQYGPGRSSRPHIFYADPLQPGEVHLHSWMLYTPQAPILDLTGEHIKTKEDIKAAFHALNLCSQEEEEQKSDGRKEKEPVKVSTYHIVILPMIMR